MDYQIRKAYHELIRKENEKITLSEEVPGGAMDSGSYLQASLQDPNSKNAVYVAFKGSKCKTFPCKVTRRKFLDENADWKPLESVNEGIEMTLEENLFWEEISALYLNENGDTIDDIDIDMFLECDDIELLDEQPVNERILKTVIRSKGKKIVRLTSSKKGYKVIKNKHGVPHEMRLTPQDKARRKKSAARAKKYYKKSHRK